MVLRGFAVENTMLVSPVVPRVVKVMVPRIKESVAAAPKVPATRSMVPWLLSNDFNTGMPRGDSGSKLRA